MDENKQKVLDKFIEIYGPNKDIRTFFAPGRVNLIGEHIDYNGGYVLPCALSIGTYAAVSKRDDDELRFYSINFPESGIITRSINDADFDKEAGFSNYPLSVIWALKQKGYKVDKGLDIVFYGNIPNSSGLSSSASIEVLVAFICNELFDLKISLVELAKISQFAENNFIGVACGIMDQFAIALGQENHAIYLNTNTLKYEYIPVDLKDNSLVIACSNKKRGLLDSKYNERRAECDRALEIINKTASKKGQNFKYLCDLSPKEFEILEGSISNPILKKRAKHVVYENHRTLLACATLKLANLEEFGKLLNESHTSLKDQYEVTGVELDTLAYTSQAQKGVLGSRMTGAGFGGCTISIVNSNLVNDFITNVGKTYLEKIGYPADFYIAKIGGGPQELK